MRFYCNAGPDRRPAFCRWLRALLPGAFALLLELPAAAQPTLALVPLEVGDHTIHAELADTPDRMRDGLMGRTLLAADSGMLFMLGPPDDLYCFWMKNTLLPL